RRRFARRCEVRAGSCTRPGALPIAYLMPRLLRALGIERLGVVEAGNPLPRDPASDKSLQRAKGGQVVRRHKADGISDHLRPTGAPDPMHIVLGLGRKVVIDDV